MYKERCPSCEARFPLLGPKMKIADANKLRSKISFECPACGARLERRLSSTEKLVKLAGAVALLCSFCDVNLRQFSRAVGFGDYQVFLPAGGCHVRH